jgi:SSS family solute:Na+ symporter
MILIIYIMVFLAIGAFASFSIKRSDDFYVAGRKESVCNVTLSLLSTILGSSAILGTISLSQKTGWAASWMMICGSLGLLCLIPLAKYVRRYGQFTLPDLLEKFYGTEMKRMACILIPIAWTGVIAVQVIGSAKIISYITPISYGQGALISSALFTIYTMLGGQISVIQTDKWQGIFIVIALGTAVISSLFHFEMPQWSSITATFPFNSAFSIKDLLILILTYASVFFVGPDIYSRIFCARDERTATLSVIIVALLLAPIGFLLAFIGTTGQLHSFDFLKTGAIPFIIAVGLFSAMISSADKTLLTASAIFGELFTDLNKDSSITLTRVLMFIFGMLSALIAIILPNIIETLMLAFSFFTGAFVIPTAAGLLGFRTSKQRAIAAALTGGGLALAGKILLIMNNDLGSALIIDAFILNAAILFLWRKK